MVALVAMVMACACGTTHFNTVTLTPSPRLGKIVPPSEIERMNLTIFVDGRGLPSGEGSVRQGSLVFAGKCAACHGNKGQGGSAEELVGGTRPLDSSDPDRTIGRFWPYATTLFDYIRHAMPADAPGSLSNDEVYAVTAWLLNAEGLLGMDATLNSASLPSVRMPNREGFVVDDTEVPTRAQGRTPLQ